MNLAAALLAPLMLLLPAAGAVEPVRDTGDRPASPAQEAERPQGRLATATPSLLPGFDTPEAMVWEVLLDSFRDDHQGQVRIEQHMVIRITPRVPRIDPNFLDELPSREVGPRFEERRMGRCVPVSGIAGVQVSNNDRLILFMRDRSIVSAALERACHARDFYSGFLVQRSTDGMLCVDRDKLQSRAGANCALTRFRQLIEVGQ